METEALLGAPQKKPQKTRPVSAPNVSARGTVTFNLKIRWQRSVCSVELIGGISLGLFTSCLEKTFKVSTDKERDSRTRDGSNT